MQILFAVLKRSALSGEFFRHKASTRQPSRAQRRISLTYLSLYNVGFVLILRLNFLGPFGAKQTNLTTGYLTDPLSHK